MRILTIVGARPQFIKAAVLRKRFSEARVEELLVHTGQHYDFEMSGVFFEELSIAPADFQIDLTHRSHGGMTGEMLIEIEQIMLREKPDWCLLYGDTNSTLAGAIAASKLHIPISHVEAGLRTFDKRGPEEVNRVLTDHVSALLFAPTSVAVENLRLENITEGVFHVGDIMFDALKLFEPLWTNAPLPVGLSDGYSIATLHRAETVNSEGKLREALDYLTAYARTSGRLILTLHPNTKRRIDTLEYDMSAIEVIEPVSYLAMQRLLSGAKMVVTDSGGLQKEAYFHGVRCITMRDRTEWTETVDHGWNRIWTDSEFACEPKPIIDYGSADSADKIVEIMRKATADR